MSIKASETPAVEQAGRDEELWHVSHEDRPTYSLCGLKLDNEFVEPLGTLGTADRCVVCDELAQAYIEGRWSP